MISIYKAECNFFPSCSTPISPFVTITTFFFVEGCNSLAQKQQFWQSVLGSFGKLVPITIHYLSLFKITKSGLKKICAFSCSKIKPLTQSTNPMLLKLFSLAALLLSPPICLAPNEIEAPRPCADPTLLKPFPLMPLFLRPHDRLQSLEMNMQSPTF